MARHGIPGVSVALVHEGEFAWLGGYGVADREAATPVGASTVFESGSIAKSLMAWGVMRLVEDGRVDLDAPATDYLERWRFPDSPFPAEEITARQLLSNSAGLPFLCPRGGGALAHEHVTGGQTSRYRVENDASRAASPTPGRPHAGSPGPMRSAARFAVTTVKKSQATIAAA